MSVTAVADTMIVSDKSSIVVSQFGRAVSCCKRWPVTSGIVTHVVSHSCDEVLARDSDGVLSRVQTATGCVTGRATLAQSVAALVPAVAHHSHRHRHAAVDTRGSIHLLTAALAVSACIHTPFAVAALSSATLAHHGPCLIACTTQGPVLIYSLATLALVRTVLSGLVLTHVTCAPNSPIYLSSTSQVCILDPVLLEITPVYTFTTTFITTIHAFASYLFIGSQDCCVSILQKSQSTGIYSTLAIIKSLSDWPVSIACLSIKPNKESLSNSNSKQGSPFTNETMVTDSVVVLSTALYSGAHVFKYLNSTSLSPVSTPSHSLITNDASSLSPNALLSVDCESPSKRPFQPAANHPPGTTQNQMRTINTSKSRQKILFASNTSANRLIFKDIVAVAVGDTERFVYNPRTVVNHKDSVKRVRVDGMSLNEGRAVGGLGVGISRTAGMNLSVLGSENLSSDVSPAVETAVPDSVPTSTEFSEEDGEIVE